MSDHDHHPGAARGDREFDDYLARRRPLFRLAEDDVLEPPPELDRIVLRQAREAIQSPRPMPVYRSPRWGAPLAIAATLVLGFAFVFRAGLEDPTVQPQVTVESAAQRMDTPAPDDARGSSQPAAATPAPGTSTVVVQLTPASAPAAEATQPARVAEPVARPAAAPASPPPSTLARVPGASHDMASTPASPEASPPWRQDPRAWLAEIERLRTSGDVARADAEQAEYNRQHRALAVSPDR